jgi:hypothetical protein
MICKVHEICTTPKKTHLHKKKKQNFGEVVAVVKLIPEQQEEQLRPLGLANEAKTVSNHKICFTLYLMYFLLCVCNQQECEKEQKMKTNGDMLLHYIHTYNTFP